MIELWLIGGWMAFVALAILFVRLGRSGEGQAVSNSVPIKVSEALDDRCALCNSTLGRRVTSDQVVFELQRRITAERAAISEILLQPHSGRMERLYLS